MRLFFRNGIRNEHKTQPLLLLLFIVAYFFHYCNVFYIIQNIFVYGWFCNV